MYLVATISFSFLLLPSPPSPLSFSWGWGVGVVCFLWLIDWFINSSLVGVLTSVNFQEFHQGWVHWYANRLSDVVYEWVSESMVVLLSLSGQATSVLPNCSDFSVRENARTLTWSLSTGCWLIGKLEDDYWDFRKSVLLRWVSKYYTAQPVKTVVFQFRLSQQLYSVFVLFCCFFVCFFLGGSVQLASTVVFGFRAARKHCGLWF